MDDRIKESISALLDNEADGLELSRVLNHSEDPAMRALWSRYSKVSDLLSSGQRAYDESTHKVRENILEASEKGGRQPFSSNNSFLAIDISAQISRSIDQIDGSERGSAESAKDKPSTNKKGMGLVSMIAIAATIVMAVSLVFKPFDDISDIRDEVLVASNVANNSGSVTVIERPYSSEHARMLNQYLLRHAENSVSGGRPGLMPLARVASFTIEEN
ncbi:sigma-E factor negative regulatory protein [Alkalimarinus alittae]|uniref:Sigma-E factor negative regulatory protein n=1 Tax=Alkalimarinus alittae TaxID=2961619 RepID=A0ABY6MZH1_9ALTE|nr:sigma-E factor negative regulatory protein [Alkalimarinus alittae]UZE95234.1 sigma-E factor negative regulatory protein [Alkalimarinus alittae]